MDSDGLDARIHKMQTVGLKFCWFLDMGTCWKEEKTVVS